MSMNLAGKTFAILATDGFEQSELQKPKTDLQNAGATWQDAEVVVDGRQSQAAA